MNESMTSLLVIFSEVGIVLALLVIVAVILIMRRKQRNNRRALKFVESLRDHEATRKSNLMDVLQKVHEMDQEMASKAAEAMLGCEKKIYNRALKLFLGQERSGLEELRRDVEAMAAAYRKLVDTVQRVPAAPAENPKREAQLRAQLKQVAAEKQKLQEDLDEAMQSMESMLKEYTQMYSGGGARKEGVKHIENELTQLKRKIAENLVDDVSDDDDDIPELSPDKPA